MEKEAKRILLIFWVIIIIESIFLGWLFFLNVQDGKERISLKLELKHAGDSLTEKDSNIQDLRTQLSALEDSKKDLESRVEEFISKQKLTEGEIKGSKSATEILAKQFNQQHDDLLAKLTEISSENRKSQLSLVSKIETLLDAKRKLEMQLVGLSKGQAPRVIDRPAAATSAADEASRPGVSLGKIRVDKKRHEPSPEPKPFEGKILSVDSQYDFVIIDMGEASGIKKKDRFFVLRRDRWIGEVEIEEIYKNMSLANIVSDKTTKTLRRNDKVVPAR
ncbi:MAG: hypothetical protein ABIJ27_08190 [Candidatus Omnitrophota bacterium]